MKRPESSKKKENCNKDKHNSFTSMVHNKENLIYYLKYGGAFFIIGYLFYKSTLVSTLFFLYSISYKKYYLKNIKEKNKYILLLQFRDFLYSVSTSISAGRQMEEAIYDARNNLELIYDEKDIIIQELNKIINGMEQSKLSCGQLINKFALRSDLNEIKDFSDIYTTCRDTGADINKAVLKTCEKLIDKNSLKKELESALSQKKYETNILISMPLLILGLLNLVSPDYLTPLYTTFSGRVIMSAALLGMIVSWLMIGKITNIKI